MEFNEHFIDAQISDLVKEYDMISAINVNAARVCSEIIDGLKPVQRRTLYIMYAKDGGRKFHKIASIAGDVFGKAHPHCLHGDTEFILSNGTKKSLNELYTDEDQNFEVLTYDNRNKNICRGTMHSVRITKYVNEYHEIHLSTGGSIKCTNDHCILTMRPSKYEKTRYHEDVFVPTWVRADEIKPGDIIYGGEITNLSFEGNDVGYHSMYVPNIGSLESVFRKVYSRVVTSGLSIEKKNFISGIHKSSHGNIWEECEDAGIDVEAMIDELNYSFIRVTSVSVNKCDSSIPMFDYTVDDYGCGGIYVGSRNENSHSFTIVKNSPVAIEDSVINMSQMWRNTIPLIEPYGNNGSISGDEAGASRYVQARLSEYAIACFFEDWKDSVVDMDLSYDEETKLPEYLPAKYPNVLLNGTLGIGHALAVNIPSFNFREVVEATILLMHNPDANIILIPDSPTGADIIENDFGALCNRGIGAFTERCTYEIDPDTNTIKITTLPDLTKAIDVRAKIAEIKERGGFSELQSMDDVSVKTIGIVLAVRNDVNPYKFMRKLIEEVPGLERTYPVNITVTQNYNNYDYSIKQALSEWIKWRRDQKRVTLINKRNGLLSEQRIIEIKLFTSARGPF